MARSRGVALGKDTARRIIDRTRQAEGTAFDITGKWLPSDPAVGEDIIVKTPAGGIAARSGTTIYSELCSRCIESSDGEEKTLIETDEQIRVFNLYPDTVTGSTYVITSLTICGTRYVSGEPC